MNKVAKRRWRSILALAKNVAIAAACIGLFYISAQVVRWVSVDICEVFSTCDAAAMAAWFQAVFAGVAILIAIWVANVQHRSTVRSVRQAHDLAEHARAMAVVAVVDAVILRLEGLAKLENCDPFEAPGAFGLEFSPVVFESLQGELQAVTTSDLRSPKAISLFVLFRLKVGGLTGHTAVLSGTWPAELIKDLDQQHDTLEKQRDSVQQRRNILNTSVKGTLEHFRGLKRDAAELRAIVAQGTASE